MEGATTSSQGTPPGRRKERPHDGRGVVVGSRLGLVAGEKVLNDHPAYDSATLQLGRLYITSFRLIFAPNEQEKDHFIIKVPLQCVAHFSKFDRRKRTTTKPQVTVGGPRDYYLFMKVKCKDFRTLVLALNTEEQSYLDFYNFVVRRTFPTQPNPRHYFAFHFKPSWRDPAHWQLYDPRAEFMRQGVLNPCSQWRLSDVNQDFGMCSTYPKVLVVPKAISDTQLLKVAEFRSRGRLPILSFKHPFNQASLARSSQPLVGVVGSRSIEDEQLVEAIHHTNPNQCPLYILDARPKMNAVANTATGAGWEPTKNYKNCEVHFLGIGNIHVMRECIKKLNTACADPDDVNWSRQVEASGWLDSIKTILTCAILMVEIIDKKQASILCHCSDGWDRTSQLTSLTMLMLDGYYRTIYGFLVLIEKEWLSFGHKFRERTGHAESNHKSEQIAPIFLQFVDCTWQMLTQFPCSFEFNEYLLIFLLDALYSCQYGTFLADNAKDREEANLREETTSAWSYVLNNMHEFRNPYYKENSENILIPNVSRGRIELWRNYYLRWNWNAKSHYLFMQQYFPAHETTQLYTQQNIMLSQSLPAPPRIPTTSQTSDTSQVQPLEETPQTESRAFVEGHIRHNSDSRGSTLLTRSQIVADSSDRETPRSDIDKVGVLAHAALTNPSGEISTSSPAIQHQPEHSPEPGQSPSALLQSKTGRRKEQPPLPSGETPATST